MDEDDNRDYDCDDHGDEIDKNDTRRRAYSNLSTKNSSPLTFIDISMSAT